MKTWCSRTWIIVSCWISAAVTVAILWNWNCWSVEVKTLAAMAALLPLHVLEEWVFPAGFHFQYNMSMGGKDTPNRFPMNQQTDMITNFAGTLFWILVFVVCLVIGDTPTGLLLGSMCFCFLEVIIHTLLGWSMLKRFRSKGKRTIYGPGSITAYWGFFPLGIILLQSIMSRTVTLTDWLVCAGYLAIALLGMIVLPEGLLKTKDTKYPFPNAGYFERYLD